MPPAPQPDDRRAAALLLCAIAHAQYRNEVSAQRADYVREAFEQRGTALYGAALVTVEKATPGKGHRPVSERFDTLVAARRSLDEGAALALQRS